MIKQFIIFFSRRTIKKDKIKNGKWSDLIINPRNGKCITEGDYVTKYGASHMKVLEKV